ncbi:MAG: 4Fe-4S binding protein [Kiritimatiellae bacterium]|jgi:epoxyqueuosine reductase|nr:4Fe-4S binding protein [Kiritimatiellia bacterium]
MNTEQLKNKARACGADLVGIAPVDRFSHLPAEQNPASIFPECKSVIVLARRICRGSLRGVEEGTNFASTYQCFGYTWVEDNFLSQSSYDLSLWVEDQGFEAVPLFGYNESGMPKGVSVAPDKPAPNVIIDPRIAVMAAGLGEVGLGGFIITPEYGTRQRFSFILTDAELDGDDVRQKSLCTDCGACAAACPFGAIHLDKNRTLEVEGAIMQVAEIDIALCRDCPNGAFLASGRGNEPDRIAAACGRECMVRLEESGKLDNKFENTFRKREPWQLDAFKRPMVRDESGGLKLVDVGDTTSTGTGVVSVHATGQVFSK